LKKEAEGIRYNCLFSIVFIEQKKLADKKEAEVQKKGIIWVLIAIYSNV
jgi:hypothetical protein